MPAPRLLPLSEPGFSMCKLSASAAILQGRHLVMVNQGTLAQPAWNLPGGKLNPGESIQDAAVREAFEETGYRIKVQGLSGIYSFVNRSGLSCLRFVFVATLAGGDLKWDGQEIVEARWFHLDQVRGIRSHKMRNPTILRTIFADLRRPARYPLRVLQELAAPAA